MRLRKNGLVLEEIGKLLLLQGIVGNGENAMVHCVVHEIAKGLVRIREVAHGRHVELVDHLGVVV